MAITITYPEGDADFTGWLTGKDYTAQKIRNRLQFFLGEWFLDTRLGVPYYRDIFQRGVSGEEAAAVLRAVIEQTPGVDSVQVFTVDLDGSGRALSLSYTVTTDDGSRIDAAGETYAP